MLHVILLDARQENVIVLDPPAEAAAQGARPLIIRTEVKDLLLTGGAFVAYPLTELGLRWPRGSSRVGRSRLNPYLAALQVRFHGQQTCSAQFLRSFTSQ